MVVPPQPLPWMPYKRQHSIQNVEDCTNHMMNAWQLALYAETAENATIGPVPADLKK